MALILHIETATTVCSVALAKDGVLLALKEYNGDYSHSENLTLFIEDVFKKSNLKISDIDAVAVSIGPGSYTGLRIGVSTAKGLCYSLNKPLIGIETLKSLALEAQISNFKFQISDLICPMLDARRMEVYCAIFDKDLNYIKPTTAEIIDENSFSELLEKNRIVFFGDGAAKCKNILKHNKNTVFLNDIFPSAKDMILLAENAFMNKQFENVAYFEPFYLKDFVAGKKKKS